MGLISKPFTFSAGATIIAAQHNSNFDTVYNLVNGALDSTNLASNAAIADTQLAQITTAGKVSVAALTVGSQATGDIIYASSSSAWARLGIGTSSQILLGGTTPSWGAVPSGAFIAANALSGSVIQTVSTETGAVATGTTVTPLDDTIPQKTEGDEYMTLAITPNNASNILIIRAHAMCASTAGGDNFIMALCQDTTSNSLAAATQSFSLANLPIHLTLTHKMAAGTTSATTFKIRIGNTAAGTTTFNGLSGGRIFGGVMASSIIIQEIKA